MKTTLITLLFILPLVITMGCGSGEEEPASTGLLEGEGINIEGVWARPGAEGRMSAGYFLITNFENEADTLVAADSDIAELTEIHESFESEEGMMGMRETPEVIIPAGSTIRFEPGGLHIMFIQLTQPLQDGDEFELRLEFKNYGDVILTVPVRS